MIDIFWQIMINIFNSLLVPLVALYVLFDLIGSLLFNKR